MWDSDTETDQGPLEVVQDSERGRLKTDILALVKPYRQDPRAKPPFTAGEMIIMACICGSRASKLKGQIHIWILKTFPCYARRALDRFVDSQMGDVDDQIDMPDEAIPGFRAAFNE